MKNRKRMLAVLLSAAVSMNMICATAFASGDAEQAQPADVAGEEVTVVAEEPSTEEESITREQSTTQKESVIDDEESTEPVGIVEEAEPEEEEIIDEDEVHAVAATAEGVCGEHAYFRLVQDGSGYTLTITGTGAIYDYDLYTQPWYEDMDAIQKIVIAEGITAVGDQAFFECSNLEEVSFPASLEKIGTGVFWSCGKLETIHFSEGLKEIGEGAFDLCTNLRRVVLPDTLEKLGASAFFRCEQLETVELPAGLKSIGSRAFGYCFALGTMEIPYGIKGIESSTFHGCTELNRVFIPDTVTSIAGNAFTWCGALTDVYYSGTEAQWNAISIDPTGNESLKQATIHFSSAPYGKETRILKQPEGVTGGLKSLVTFSVNAENAASYQWQYSKDGVKWYNSTAASAKTDSISITISKNNYQNLYRCKVTGVCGDSVLTESAGIEMIPWVNILEQPESQAMTLGEYVEFRVWGENVKWSGYQWQYSKDGGAHWFNSTASGYATSGLYIKVSETNRKNMYRCVLEGIDGNKYFSDPAVFVILDEQPQPAKALVGEYGTLSLKAKGVTAYQWQYSDDWTKWYNSTASGAKTESVRFKATAANQFRVYRCRLTTESGIYAYTRPVGLYRGVIIKHQPQDVQAVIGDKVTFHVDAGNVGGYRWQYSKDGKKWYNSSAYGFETDTVTITVSASNKDNVYRCMMVGMDQSVTYTDPVRVITAS